ncbi:hypothetical protein [Pseudescherichia sp.]|uniref:hypothetical protein n=1 Tax=Pseudescherichia sp. TaxID=2055881 RepID=UPI00289A93B3|nr:hypothetical protein [Pseudescherichia sp.]WPO96940.1 hypothetical protein SFA32_08350 [Buttiauxella sp. HR94]
MDLPEDLRAAWLAAGWKRGAFIRLDSNRYLLDELPRKLAKQISGKGSVFIVPILYDCALIEESFEKEPWVQVLIIWETNFDGNFAYARNPRKIHLKVQDGGKEICLEVSALSFFQIDREAFLKAIPDESVHWKEDGLSMLLDWVAERYRQATFPDSFNKRLEPFRKALDKLWKSQLFCEYSSGIYINIDSSAELPDDTLYNIKVMIVIPYAIKGRSYRSFDEKYSKDMVTMLKTTLDAIKTIKLSSIQTISEREFTKELERDYKRFSLENFSYKSKSDESPLPAEYLGG